MEKYFLIKQRQAGSLPHFSPITALLCWLLLWQWSGDNVRASEFTEGFDTAHPSCRFRYDTSRIKLLSHQRHGIRHGGRSSEQVVVQAAQAGRMQLEYTLPNAVVIDDLKLSLWVRSNQNGAVLFLRLVFPHQTDPRTGEILTTYLRGEQYTTAGRWQELKCTAKEKQVRDQIVQLRAQLKEPLLDVRDLYVDRMMLTAPVQPGVAELFVDDLQFGPVINPQPQVVVETVGSEEQQAAFPVEFLLDRLQVNGRPFFPRLAAYHNERIDVLKQSGLNLVWVPDYQEQGLLHGMRRRGLWVTATPTSTDSPQSADGTGGDVSMVPFSRETFPILGWMLGSRIPPEARDDFVDLLQKVRNADRSFKRPVLGDFTGLEAVYSRHNLMMGMSRHILNTSFSFKQYRDWLVQKRELAQPGSFMWTWIQTEPAAIHAERREAAGLIPAVIEPEQIRLQVYAALFSGYRGIGFWKRTPLDADREGATERRLVITQLNLELELLEECLASGTVIADVPFTVPRQNADRFGQRRLDFRNTRNELEERNALLQEQHNRLKRNSEIAGELKAAIIESNLGKLLLPVWFETDAQYVPGQMAANNVTMIVSGIDESASVWEITTTDIVSLTSSRKRVTGGMQITIPKLDQTAAILFTSDMQVIESLRRKVRGMAMNSARVSIDLAAAKLDRVRKVDEELQKVHTGQPDAPQLLSSAQDRIEIAEAAFKRGDYHAARLGAADAMQLLRILQRAHWNVAVASLSSPVSSLHTVCFQTLPDHWRMVARVGRSPVRLDSNLLRSGDFEDMQTMILEGWGHSQNQVEGIRAAAELYPGGRKESYALRLIAVPETGIDELPTIISDNPVTVTTPSVTVHSGQIVHVSGWVRTVSPIVGSLDGAMLYDNISGPIGALRWNQRSRWQRFEIVREIKQSGVFHLTITLGGMGEIQFDELSIIPHSPRATTLTEENAKPPDDRSAGARALEFFNRLPRIRPRTKRE